MFQWRMVLLLGGLLLVFPHCKETDLYNPNDPGSNPLLLACGVYYPCANIAGGSEGGGTSALSAPGGLNILPADSQNSLSWTAVPGATSYYIYWNTTGAVTTGDNRSTSATNSFTHTGLVNGTTYFYVITAADANGESVPSTEVSAAPVASGGGGLSAPGGVNIVAGDSQNALTWTAVTGATSYHIYWNTTGSVSMTDTRNTVASNSFTHTGLTNGTTYYYIVTAADANGESGPSGEVSSAPAINVSAIPGLNAYYRFNGDAQDSSGNNYHGTISGTADYSTVDPWGRSSETYSVPDNNDTNYITLNSGSFNGLTDFTVAFWGKINILNTLTPEPANTFISVSKTGDADHLTLMYYYNNNEYWFMYNRLTTGGPKPIDNTVLTDLNWHHYVIKRSGTSFSVYIDNSLVMLIYLDGTALVPASNGVIIGQDQDTVGGGFDVNQSMGGSIDELRVYNRALTDGEISAIYNLASP